MLAEDCRWLNNLLTLFDRFPMVGAVGLKTYLWAFGDGNEHKGERARGTSFH